VRSIAARSAAAAVVLALAGGALAAGAVKDPRTLVLRKSDLPARAVKGPSATASPSTFGDREFTVYFNLSAGKREEVLTSDVAVSGTGKRAATGYRIMLATYTGLPGSSPYKLPAYGDGQRAEYQPDPGRGVLVVHKGKVVWQLVLEDCGPQSPAGCLGGVTPPRLTRPQALAELEKYAPKQERRVR
jgi:hypothetical protein